MRVFVTGGSGVLGRSLVPLLRQQGHEVLSPKRGELDLFDPDALALAVAGCEALLHLATRIPAPDRWKEPGVWNENDRLRAQATRLLVDAALASAVSSFVLPTVVFVYPDEGPVDETTPVRQDLEPSLASALEAERQALRSAGDDRCGVVLRLGLLYGPGTWSAEPDDDAPLHIHDAGTALLAGIRVCSGVYNVVADGGRVSNELFKTATGWRPSVTR